MIGKYLRKIGKILFTSHGKAGYLQRRKDEVRTVKQQRHEKVIRTDYRSILRTGQP